MRDLSSQLDPAGKLSVVVRLGGSPGVAERETREYGPPAVVAGWLRELAGDVAALADPEQLRDDTA